MIPPRRTAATGELDLLGALLGVAALRAPVRELVRELAEDGDRGTEIAGGVDGDTLDLVLGIAALVDVFEVAAIAAPPADEATAACDRDLAPGELLR
jgi:hypothetical protein